MALSIRWRLTLWNTAALTIVLLGFSALIFVLLTRALYERIDRPLLTELDELREQPELDLTHWIKEAKEHQNISVVVYGAGGEVALRTEELPGASIPPPSAALVQTPTFADMKLPILGHQRALRGTVVVKGQPLSVLLLTDLEEVDRERALLLTVLAMAVPVSLLAAGGLGYALARKALTPVERLHRLTAEITAERLDRRLPVPNAADELGQLTQTINAMIGRLEHSFSEIRRFTADASHELRTPLTAIRTETEVALRQPLSPADYQQLLGSILEECERLTRLTDQLLTLSREDAGAAKPPLEPVELAALLDYVVETMRPLAEAKPLTLHFAAKGPIHIWGDGARLRQVFYNLLDNAIKYTPAGGSVEVRCEAQGKEAVVLVQDTGIGIPAEHLPRVFDRFYRVDKARSRDEGGTGLGLSIARTIVTAHGGEIHLASTPGQGTTCTVRLPIEPTQPQ
jgi:heavy metal sensor kinase